MSIAAVPGAVRRDVRICFAGDSFVAGTGDPTALGWVGRVVVAGIATGLDLTAYNLGIRGATSVQVARRLAIEARPRLVVADDPRIVLSFGVNDTLPGVLLPTEATLGALRDARRRMAPTRLLLVGPTAVGDEAQNDRLRLLDTALEAEATTLGIPYVPVFTATEAADTWRRPVLAGDGFHPDAVGYALLASLAIPPILTWLAA